MARKITGLTNTQVERQSTIQAVEMNSMTATGYSYSLRRQAPKSGGLDTTTPPPTSEQKPR